MNDEFFDAEATRRVAHRAVISGALAFIGGTGGGLVPLSAVVVIPLLLVAIVVAISAIRTLSHADAAVIGGIRWVGVVLAAVGGLGACGAIVVRLIIALS